MWFSCCIDDVMKTCDMQVGQQLDCHAWIASISLFTLWPWSRNVSRMAIHVHILQGVVHEVVGTKVIRNKNRFFDNLYSRLSVIQKTLPVHGFAPFHYHTTTTVGREILSLLFCSNSSISSMLWLFLALLMLTLEESKCMNWLLIPDFIR